MGRIGLPGCTGMAVVANIKVQRQLRFGEVYEMALNTVGGYSGTIDKGIE